MFKVIFQASTPKRFFSSSSRANDHFKISLKGSAKGFKQLLIPTNEAHVQHVIKTDLYKSLGGEESAPDPIDLLYSSITGCQHITHVLIAKDHGVKVGEAQISIEANLDPIDKTPGKYPGFTTTVAQIRYEVESDAATPELFNKIREQTEAYCPIAQVFLKSEGFTLNSVWIQRRFPK